MKIFFIYLMLELAIPYIGYEKKTLIYSPNAELAVPFTGCEKPLFFTYQTLE